MPQGQIDLAAVALLGPVVARASATFRRGLQGAAVEDSGGGERISACGLPKQLAQVVGHQAPRSLRTHKPAQAVKDLTQRVNPLRSILFHEVEVRRNEGPPAYGPSLGKLMCMSLPSDGP